ncbi:MAG: hypothetical protein Q8Q74_00515 [Polaromonas sp.]|nr:hypothetical protein [Polaromonas sp.]
MATTLASFALHEAWCKFRRCRLRGSWPAAHNCYSHAGWLPINPGVSESHVEAADLPLCGRIRKKETV